MSNLLKASLLASLLIASTSVLPAAVSDDIGSDQWLYEEYNQIWAINSESIRTGNVHQDDRWQSGGSNVLTWTTALIRLRGTALQKLGSIVNKIKEMEPNQFPHKTPWLHSTVFIFGSAVYPNIESVPVGDSILRTYGPSLEEGIVRSEISPFRLKLNGIVADRRTVLAKGYSGGNIQMLRDEIACSLSKYNIKHNYRSGLNHSSLVRFCSPLANPTTLYNFINENSNTDLGYTDVVEVELVRHIWLNDECGKRKLFEERIAIFPIR